MTTRHIPPLLAPLLTIPTFPSLTLLTGTLDATTNWLVLRFLSAALADRGQRGRGREDGDGERVADGRERAREEELGIVIVSFLRSYEFWRAEGSRVGLDLEKYIRTDRFVFVDGLDGLFLQKDSLRDSGQRVLRSAELSSVEKEVLDAVEGASVDGGNGGDKRRVLLVVDGIDLVLAATGGTARDLGDVIGEWREKAHSMVLTLSADFPLMQSRTTPLETQHVAFVADLAHQSRLILSLRGLDTGVARDVSGVLRISKGGGWMEEDVRGKQEHGRGEEVAEKELLYFVVGDGGAKVWERGSQST